MAKPSGVDARIRVPLSRDRVLRAAISLADQGGIASLSMRKLAKVLDVKAMSLYNHVKNREDILDGMVDIVISEIDVPIIDADWKVAMRLRAISAHEALLRHPWSTMEIVSRVNVGPAMLRYVDATLECLCTAGFSFEMADHAWNAIDSHIYGFTLQELNFPFEEAEYSGVAASYLSMIPESQYPYLNKLTCHVMNGQYDGVHDFEFGLGLLLNGLEALKISGW